MVREDTALLSNVPYSWFDLLNQTKRTEPVVAREFE